MLVNILISSEAQGRIQYFEKVDAGAKRPKKNFRTRVRNSFAPTLFAPNPFSHSSLIGPYWKCCWDEEM